VALGAGDTQAPMQVLRHVLARMGLSLNEAKTPVVDARDEAFDFVGFRFCLCTSRRSGKRYPHVECSRAAVQSIKDRSKVLTDRRRTSVLPPLIVTELNRCLCGWSNYLHYRNSTQVMAAIKMHAEQRVRTHPRRRHKLVSRAQAYQRLPGRVHLPRPGAV